MKYICSIVIFCFGYFLPASSQTGQLSTNKKGDGQPIFILDSVRTNRNALDQIQPTDILSISVYKDEHAIKLIGPDGANGVVYIETKKFARTKYWKLLTNNSAEYLQAVPSAESDSNVAYILNGTVLTKDVESQLSSVTVESLISLRVINKETLSRQYGITNKSTGVVITTKKKVAQ